MRQFGLTNALTHTMGESFLIAGQELETALALPQLSSLEALFSCDG